jgi:TonB family protein
VQLVRATHLPELKNRAEFAVALERVYPPELRNRGLGGTTVYAVRIDPDGAVQAVHVLQSSGFLALDQGGAGVFRQARFSSAVAQGCRVAMWIQIPLTFQVREGGPKPPA